MVLKKEGEREVDGLKRRKEGGWWVVLKKEGEREVDGLKRRREEGGWS